MSMVAWGLACATQEDLKVLGDDGIDRKASHRYSTLVCPSNRADLTSFAARPARTKPLSGQSSRLEEPSRSNG